MSRDALGKNVIGFKMTRLFLNPDNNKDHNETFSLEAHWQ